MTHAFLGHSRLRLLWPLSVNPNGSVDKVGGSLRMKTHSGMEFLNLAELNCPSF